MTQEKTDQAAPELLPCPFCGRGAEYKEDTGEYRNFASCTSRECGASICGVWLEDPTTIQRWNHRESADMAECAAFSAGYEAGEAGRADLAAPSAPAEVEGLVERLKDAAKSKHIAMMWPCVSEAATALTALQADNERLRGEIEELQGAQILDRAALRLQKMARKKAEAERDDWKANAVALAAVLEVVTDALDYGDINVADSVSEPFHRALAAHAKLKGDV